MQEFKNTKFIAGLFHIVGSFYTKGKKKDDILAFLKEHYDEPVAQLSERYIAPMIIGAEVFESGAKAGMTYDKEIFAQAWQIVANETSNPNKSWFLIKKNALEKYTDDNKKALFELSLDAAYEAYRNLPWKNTKLEDEKKKRNLQEIDKLYADVSEYRKSENYRELIEFIKNFPNIAPYNAMLVKMQKPGSRYVASPEEWLKKYKRTPKTGARPLIVLRTFGPVSFVYELNDTEGDEFPDDAGNPFKADGDADKALRYLMENLKKEGIGYIEADYGSESAGFIQWVAGKDPFAFPPKKKNGKIKTVPHEYDIVVNRNFSPPEKCATIFHELGHYFLGHIRHSKGNKNVPKRGAEIESLLVREFEAETVCWLLCERCGISNPSAKYLRGYLDNNDNIPDNISIDTVLKACGKIENMLSHVYPLRTDKAKNK